MPAGTTSRRRGARTFTSSAAGGEPGSVDLRDALARSLRRASRRGRPPRDGSRASISTAEEDAAPSEREDGAAQ
jgi:hypothetical protein